jgi:hypothetical protein
MRIGPLRIDGTLTARTRTGIERSDHRHGGTDLA